MQGNQIAQDKQLNQYPPVSPSQNGGRPSIAEALRMGNSMPHYHQDHIAGRGDKSLQHYNLVHKFIPKPQAMKIPAAKAAVDKE